MKLGDPGSGRPRCCHIDGPATPFRRGWLLMGAILPGAVFPSLGSQDSTTGRLLAQMDVLIREHFKKCRALFEFCKNTVISHRKDSPEKCSTHEQNGGAGAAPDESSCLVMSSLFTAICSTRQRCFSKAEISSSLSVFSLTVRVMSHLMMATFSETHPSGDFIMLVRRRHREIKSRTGRGRHRESTQEAAAGATRRKPAPSFTVNFFFF